MDQGCEEAGGQQQRHSCGRYIFREADLAYLMINEERMFPLAELLASLFGNTARTTLFTRMEKINTRRHFCSAEEIKLLKTVNGIHGSSAICTLIPEADVQKYCAVYIDRSLDIKLFCARRAKATRNDTTKDSKHGKGGNLTTESNDGKSATSSNVESNNATKSLKRKRASSNKQKLNNRGKTKVPRVRKNTQKSNHSQLLVERCEGEVNRHPNSLATLADHVLNNGSQTLQTGRVVKARKKRKAEDDNSLPKYNSRQTKKTRISNASESKPCRRAWKHGIAARKADADNLSSVGSMSTSCTDILQQYGSSLSRCLTNASSEILFSDASSNDSGFASTTTSESLIRNNPSACLETNRGKKARNFTVTLPSPSKDDKNKKPTKGNVESNADKQHDQSLSPPALVIKRQNNTWLVETKSEEKDNSRCKTAISNKAKKRLKWPSCKEPPVSNKKVANKKVTSKMTVKMKKKRKITISDKDETGTAIQVVSQGRNVKNRKTIRTKLSQHCYGSGEVNIKDSTIKNGSLFKTCSTSKKRGKSTKDQNKQLDIDSTNSRLRNNNKVTVAKTLKANQNFKLMSLFSSFPVLSMKQGDLCPSFSEVLPEKSNGKLATSHPIWKWQRGRPIYIHENRKAHVR